MVNTCPPTPEEAASAGQRPFVELTDVSLTYGDFGEGLLALKDFNLSVRQGEFCALVGPSGCGKSTTLKLVSGLRQPDAGGVIVAGKEVSKPLKIVGMAFQNPTLLPGVPHWTTCSCRWRSSSPTGAGSARRRPSTWTGRWRCSTKSGSRMWPTVSLAALRRHAAASLLCRSLIHEPDLLLLDEPFGALDAFTREDLWDTVKTLWQEQKFTTLLITHDLTESVYMAESVHVLSARPGRVIHSQRIPEALRRTREDRFSPAFADAVYALRQHVGHAQEDPS
ncbi:ABC transporter ATP-binding protein [Alcanivorax sp. IO_7]|nr:ABC transporter ATP-binding protein [Alcanivorax sp. IO_7]